MLSVPVTPGVSWAPVGSATPPPLCDEGEEVTVGCESPAVPVRAGPWLGPGLMVPHLYSTKSYLKLRSLRLRQLPSFSDKNSTFGQSSIR